MRFTFHYASTLCILSDHPHHLRIHLHSTMLLLYVKENDSPCCSCLYLHSTMLLLYDRSDNGIVSVNDIYIPLCFYFMCNFYVHIWIFLIYIPLCFYFIKLFPCTYIIAHYLHSTMLLLYQVCEQWDQLFAQYLHSTMLLLYSVIKHAYNAVFEIYIPLCFYFIWQDREDDQQRDQFTFHYASTL